MGERQKSLTPGRGGEGVLGHKSENCCHLGFVAGGWWFPLFLGAQMLLEARRHWPLWAKPKPTFNLDDRQSESRFYLSICPSMFPFSISTIFYQFPQVIKLHGALPDGRFSHFSVLQGLCEVQAKHSYLKIILRSLINRKDSTTHRSHSECVCRMQTQRLSAGSLCLWGPSPVIHSSQTEL